ncbi:hypothetical protein BV22DRAFT_1135189 [Leucogyrophana mollusca]|uniref:Uncharacterized protein n=1 Tax=Leucogyrophana mollusca TaxID=85980 RepID=A0ACB8AXL2_9AGAM|nr:hypothetical protein BV22DRAFT_1135189 [Leucogyrophana mollusca]
MSSSDPNPRLASKLEAELGEEAETDDLLHKIYNSLSDSAEPTPMHNLASQDNNQEVRLVLEVARAQCEVFRAEKLLTSCVMREHETIASLYRFKADKAGDRVDRVDMRLGRMRASFKRFGQSVCPSLSHRSQSSSTSMPSLTVHLD